MQQQFNFRLMINVINNFSRYETTSNPAHFKNPRKYRLPLENSIKLTHHRPLSKVFDLHYPRINGTTSVSKVRCSKSEEAVDKSSRAHLKAHQSVHSSFPLAQLIDMHLIIEIRRRERRSRLGSLWVLWEYISLFSTLVLSLSFYITVLYVCTLLYFNLAGSAPQRKTITRLSLERICRNMYIFHVIETSLTRQFLLAIV